MLQNNASHCLLSFVAVGVEMKVLSYDIICFFKIILFSDQRSEAHFSCENFSCHQQNASFSETVHLK